MSGMAAPHTGTTIVAVSYDGGVVLGADSRVSMGSYISNRASDKLAPLADSVWLLRSGSAADTQAVADYVRHFAAQHSMELGTSPSVKSVAHLAKQINYNNKHLVGALIVAGWDNKAGGQIFGIPIGGTIVQEQWAIDGSGSTFIWGYLDSVYREGMTQAEAEEVVSCALALAMARDGSSGGMCRLVICNMNGSERKEILGDKVALSYDERDVHKKVSTGPTEMTIA